MTPSAAGAASAEGLILAIETSCDDTCAAVVSRGGAIRSNVVASQGLLHERYGGVVPEVASRQHLEAIDSVVDDALELAGMTLGDVETVAVTQRPGLIGALLVGLSSAKALAAARGLPLVPVDHLHGHVTASMLALQGDPLGDALRGDPIEPPYLCLVASGGHTFIARVDDPSAYKVLGRTLDDAAGEAFDKGARLLGLGYPGGPAIDRLAREGDPEAFDFPRSQPGELGRDGRMALDFSFSGLKTSLLYALRDLRRNKPSEKGQTPFGGLSEWGTQLAADLAASYQRAIVDALLIRLEQAIEREGLERVALGGGVAANSELRERAAALAPRVWIPPLELCTDNAAMIAGAARFTEPIAYPRYLALDAAARA